jgi:hypothetical protein
MSPEQYRLYALSGAGAINLANWIEAETDEQAIAKARQVGHGALKVEIWQRNRLVATLDGPEIPEAGILSGMDASGRCDRDIA